jgi:hypothetical protein
MDQLIAPCRRRHSYSVLQVEREVLIRLRDEEQISDDVLRTLQHELDLTESRVHTGSILKY